MAQMAVEACVTQMLNTGFVHADPHEGNMLLADNGQLIFLDFGLISRMEPNIMEGFAEGIQYMISGDWYSLSRVFQAVGFVPPDGYFRFDAEGNRVEVSEEEFVGALRNCIESQEGGTSRFGALATGLAALSEDYEVRTPPYIILLCRTFLTLEGMAGTADPTFNIYKASLPYAIRRAMSPSTKQGVQALRNAWLTEQGHLQWDRLESLVSASEEEKEPEPDGEAPEMGEEISSASSAMAERGSQVVSGLLGANEGRTVRRMAYDVDTVNTVYQLASHKESREMGVEVVTDLLRSYLHKAEEKTEFQRWYMSPEAESIQERQDQRKDKIIKFLVKHHFRRLLTGGLRGYGALCIMTLVLFRVVLEAAFRVGSSSAGDLIRAVGTTMRRLLPSLKRPAKDPAPALA
jgi:hypothetical protein